MAGSYNHCTTDDGSFTFDLIDNLGDAHEACEEMHAMIRYLAGGDPLKIETAHHAYLAQAYPHHVRECEFCGEAKPLPMTRNDQGGAK
jgi:hypothetical protein